jgi:hypothetical protein
MLASIHPLGERARGHRFSVTVTAYTIGSTLGGAAFGALLGAAGQLVFGDSALGLRGGVLAVGAVAAAILDGGRKRIRSWHRQVNEDWLTSYRGWVYGLGFGAELGIGVITIVTSASVYLTWLAAFVVAKPWVGALIGAGFGVARAVPVLAGGVVTSPAAIGARVRRLHAWDGRFRVVTVGAEATAALVGVVVLVAR